MSLATVVAHIEAHRCYTHPFFDNWAGRELPPVVLGALFHQIRHFCDATRPGGNFPEGLRRLGLRDGAALIEEIVASEANHGRDLAVMAGYILNCAAGREVCRRVDDQVAVERTLKDLSDQVFGPWPGYDPATGLLPQTRAAKAVFERRELTDEGSTYRNLGTTLALELLANRLIIPGEVRCLVGSKRYGVSLADREMHYLAEHYGEAGAEAEHEQKALAALAPVVTPAAEALVTAGADELLGALAELLDQLDRVVLQSGRTRDVPALA